jgi:carboxyl-terminal processing protease
MIVDGDKVDHPKTDAEAADRWRRRIKYDLLVIKASDKDEYDDAKARDRLRRRYHSFARRMHQTNSDDLLEMYLTSLTTCFDPHTTYMSPTTLENFYIDMRKQLDGIGASLQSIDGYCVINQIIPGGAADKEGNLEAKDRIVGVGQGKEGEIVDVVDQRLTDVVNLIRGKQGTIVRLEVLKGGEGERKIIQITRAKIELTDRIARSEVFEEGKKANGAPYKVGVIDLPSFYMDMEAARRNDPNFRSTTRDCRAILQKFKKDNVDALILDLRRNGGGSLTEAINLTGLFIDTGPVVQVKGANGEVQQLKDSDAGTEWDGPLVVLTSKFSASASEIFAGAMQDYRRGLIVGDAATHGKGTVQQLLDVGERLFRLPNSPNLGALKITIQKFYRPGGDSTQMRGVLADVELPSLTTHLADISESDLDFALEFDRVPEADHADVAMISKPMVSQLRDLSQHRVAKSKDFDRVHKNIKRYLAQKDRTEVTLNEVKFLAERAEHNAEKAEEDEFKDLNDPDRPVVRRDYYFNEVLAVTLDYVGFLKKHMLAGGK